MTSIFQQTEVVAAIIGAIVGGVIGILGSVASFAISALLRNKGNLVLFTNKSKIVLYKQNVGAYVETTELKEAENINLCIDIDVYNQSDIPKTIGDFKIELKNKKSKRTFETKKYRRSQSGIPISENVPTQTIFPKQASNIECTTILHQADFYELTPKVDIYLLANYPDNKKFRVKVLDMQVTAQVP